MNDKIKIKQLELLYSHLPISILTGYVAVGFISIVIWKSVNYSNYLLWLIIFNLIMVYRIALLLFYKKYDLNITNFSLWDNLNFISTLLTGLIWSTLTIFYSPDWQVEEQVSIWVLLIALMSGASASFSVVLKYYVAYCAPIFLLSIYTQFSVDNYYMLTLYSVYMLMLTLTSFNFHKAQNQIILHQVVLLETNVQLENLATKDSLTNLPNRRAFEENFNKEWASHVRSNKDLSLLMIDVDYFKNYNDHYGHDAGDECLISMALIIEESLHRPSDKVARYGGEEFIIILPETTTEGAAEVADRIHYNLRIKKISHDFSTVGKYLTVSIGIASVIPESDMDSKLLQIMADRELYKAKANGRNCTSYVMEENN